LAAGVLEALRSNSDRDCTNVPPADLKQYLIDSARQIVGTGLEWEVWLRDFQCCGRLRRVALIQV
jgi:hypothetical protein